MARGVVSIIIAGALLTAASGGYKIALNIFAHIAGTSRGHALVDLSIVTIRNVVKGVLGVAFIQMLLATVGLLVAGVPATGLWAGAVLVLAIIQLPPILVLGPIGIWLFTVTEPLPAAAFLIYSLIVSASDAFLKPLFLGRGVDVPMLVILIGAIGGALWHGVVGLFIGAVVLALGYQLFLGWLATDEAEK